MFFIIDVAAHEYFGPFRTEAAAHEWIRHYHPEMAYQLLPMSQARGYEKEQMVHPSEIEREPYPEDRDEPESPGWWYDEDGPHQY